MSALRLLNPTRFRKSYVPYSATLQQSRESFPRLLPALLFNDIMQGVLCLFPWKNPLCNKRVSPGLCSGLFNFERSLQCAVDGVRR